MPPTYSKGKVHASSNIYTSMYNKSLSKDSQIDYSQLNSNLMIRPILGKLNKEQNKQVESNKSVKNYYDQKFSKVKVTEASSL
jgi:hypothetical protein